MRLELRTVPLGPRSRTALERVAGLQRVVFERAVLAALRIEERRYRARQRAEASRYRRLFGWVW